MIKDYLKDVKENIKYINSLLEEEQVVDAAFRLGSLYCYIQVLIDSVEEKEESKHSKEEKTHEKTSGCCGPSRCT